MNCNYYAVLIYSVYTPLTSELMCDVVAVRTSTEGITNFKRFLRSRSCAVTDAAVAAVVLLPLLLLLDVVLLFPRAVVVGLDCSTTTLDVQPCSHCYKIKYKSTDAVACTDK
jgi:hypothetical protein